MVTNTQERAWRMDEIRKGISKKKTNKQEVIAQIMCKWGFSRRTVMEYLSCLLMAKHLHEGEGMIWARG